MVCVGSGHRRVRVLRGHSHGVFGVAYTPDGGQLASIAWDGSVRLWNVASGRQTPADLAMGMGLKTL